MKGGSIYKVNNDNQNALQSADEKLLLLFLKICFSLLL